MVLCIMFKKLYNILSGKGGNAIREQGAKAIAFYQPHLDIRGTGVSYFDFARYNETILGNISYVICDRNDRRTHPLARKKFKESLKVIELSGSENMCALESKLKDLKVDAVYIQKCGKHDDGRYVHNIPNLIHVAGRECDPHGLVYAYTSEWGAKAFGDDRFPWVPFPISLPDFQFDLRERYKIPIDAFVAGRYGGFKSWDVPWVSETVDRLLHEETGFYFLAANTPRFTSHPRTIFLEPFADLDFKRKFINSCNCMLHARSYGESFGLAIAEFSLCGRPIVTQSGVPEQAHIHMLGSKGIYYKDRTDLYSILKAQDLYPSQDYNAYSDFSPENVMRRFKNVFLDAL